MTNLMTSNSQFNKKLIRQKGFTDERFMNYDTDYIDTFNFKTEVFLSEA